MSPVSHDLINCCMNRVTVYTNPCLARPWHSQNLSHWNGKYEKHLKFAAWQYQIHIYTYRGQENEIWHASFAHLLICLLNRFPFYGVTTFFCPRKLHKSPFSTHQIWASDILDKTCHLSRAYIGESVDLGRFGWVDLKVSGFRRCHLGVGMPKPEDFHSECLLSMKEHWKQTQQIEKHWNQLIQSILRYGLLFGKRTVAAEKVQIPRPRVLRQRSVTFFDVMVKFDYHILLIIIIVNIIVAIIKCLHISARQISLQLDREPVRRAHTGE